MIETYNTTKLYIDYMKGREISMREHRRERLKKITSKKLYYIFNLLAYTSCSSYSFVGAYEPKKPEKLKK